MQGRSRDHHGALTEAERRVDEALRDRSGAESHHPRLDVHAAEFDGQCTVRGEYLARRLVESTDDGGWWPFSRRSGRRPVAVVEDAVITGCLDLRAMELPHLLQFVRCRFDNPPDLRQATLPGVMFGECRLPGLEARNLRTAHDTVLRSSLCDGVLNLADAECGGSLLLDDSELHRPGRRALYGDRLSVAGALLGQRLSATGELRMPGAKIGGNLNFSGGRLHRPGGLVLNANGAHIGGSLRLDRDPRSAEPARAIGLLYLPSAHIAGDIRMAGAVLDPGVRPSSRDESRYDDPSSTLVADRADVRGGVLMRDGFRSKGTLRAVSASIGGDVRMGGARVDLTWSRSPSEFAVDPLRALHWDGTVIRGNVEAERAELRGQLRLSDLHVHGSFLLTGARVHAPRTDVIRAGRLQLGGDLDGRSAEVTGTLHLQGARIGASVDMRGARLGKPAWHPHRLSYKPSIDLRTARVERDLVCAAGDRPFSAEGEVQLRRAEIGRQANFWGCELGEVGTATALNAFGLLAQELTLLPAGAPVGRVVLRQAQCELLSDNAELWSASGGVRAEDFRFDTFSTPIEPTDRARVVERLRWLRTSRRRYAPEPYDQLAQVFRQNGTEQHASVVLIEKQRRRYQAIAASAPAPLRWTVRLWSFLQRATVSYGYRPSRAVLWILVLVALGTAWFAEHPLQPANPRERLVWNPFLYTLDHMIPVVNLGHETVWRATGASQWITVALVATGWLLATTAATGITRTLRRTDGGDTRSRS
ncbi:AsmA family protein [Salinifilum ghardaiensis]